MSARTRNLLHRRQGYDPFADSCLVGDDQEPKTCLREPDNCTTRARQEMKLLPALDVIPAWAIAVEDAIAVKEDRGHRALLSFLYSG
jgi:hypothetical protein